MEKIKEMEAECIKLMRKLNSVSLDWKDWGETPNDKREPLTPHVMCRIILDGKEEVAYVTHVRLTDDGMLDFETILCRDLTELEEYWIEEVNTAEDDDDDEDREFKHQEDIRYIEEAVEEMTRYGHPIVKDEDFFSDLLVTLSAMNLK